MHPWPAMRRSPLLVALALAAACGPAGAPGVEEHPDGAPAAAADAASSGPARIELAVAGDAAWTDSDLLLARGELVRVTASGTIAFDGETQVGPEGFAADDHDRYNLLACADHAALLARVDGGGGAFLLAGQDHLLAPRAGELALGPNDTRTVDNTGAFAVVVEPDQPVEMIEQRSVTVPGDATWIDTGIDLVPDYLLAIDGDGRVDNNVPGNDVGPEGAPGSADDPYNVLACANHMALIGKIGTGGAPFAVGRDLSRPAGASGRLFLRVNHSAPQENTGKFSAGILVAAPR